MESNYFGLMFLLFIVFLSGEMLQTHARMCYSVSKTYEGVCFNNHNCARVCVSEGFTSGYCKKFLRRCICAITCSGSPAFNPPFGMPPAYGEAPPGEAPPGSREGMLLAFEETSESSHNKELSPEGAPEPSPAEEIFPLHEGSPSEMSPGEAPAPSPSEEISPEEVPGSSLPETLRRNPAASRPFL